MFPFNKHISLHTSFADLDPCLDVICPSFGVCKTYSAHDARCVCFEDCPSYQDLVCTANGTTYDNKCWHELSYCRGLENNLVYHPGSCEGKGGKLPLKQNNMPCGTFCCCSAEPLRKDTPLLRRVQVVHIIYFLTRLNRRDYIKFIVTRLVLFKTDHSYYSGQNTNPVCD